MNDFYIIISNISHKSPLGLKHRQCIDQHTLCRNSTFYWKNGSGKDQIVDHLVIKDLIPCYQPIIPKV